MLVSLLSSTFAVKTEIEHIFKIYTPCIHDDIWLIRPLLTFDSFVSWRMAVSGDDDGNLI